MNEEILRIQKMVAEGKITPEEGTELIASLSRPATSPPAPAAAAPPPNKSDRKAVGIVALCALGLALATGPWAPLVAACLIPLSIILGFIGWQSLCGKVAAIGGLLILILLVVLFFYHNQAHSISLGSPESPKIEMKYIEATPLQKAESSTPPTSG